MSSLRMKKGNIKKPNIIFYYSTVFVSQLKAAIVSDIQLFDSAL